jgi:hypothetical protein
LPQQTERERRYLTHAELKVWRSCRAKASARRGTGVNDHRLGDGGYR